MKNRSNSSKSVYNVYKNIKLQQAPAYFLFSCFLFTNTSTQTQNYQRLNHNSLIQIFHKRVVNVCKTEIRRRQILEWFLVTCVACSQCMNEFLCTHTKYSDALWSKLVIKEKIAAFHRGDISIWVKNSRVGTKIQIKQSFLKEVWVLYCKQEWQIWKQGQNYAEMDR